MLALLPGFTLNRRFMEQMMGVKEPLPAEHLEEFRRETDRLADEITTTRFRERSVTP